MKWTSFLIGLCLLLSAFSKPAHATTLEVVFEDTMWGAALGAVVGTAIWALGPAESDKLGGAFLRGTAAGVLIGLGYGFYDAHKLGYVQQTPSLPKGLVHYDASQHQVSLRIPSIQLNSPTHLASSLQMPLVSAQF